jgi:hypothetical protein
VKTFLNELKACWASSRNLADVLPPVPMPNSFNREERICCLGSGCSLGIAHLAKAMFNELGYHQVQCLTPYLLITELQPFERAVLVSLSGEHEHALRAFRYLMAHRIPTIVLTNRGGSLLGQLVLKFPGLASVFAPTTSCGPGGFVPVAPSAVLAAILLHSYFQGSSSKTRNCLQRLVHSVPNSAVWRARSAHRAGKIESVLVVASAAAQAAAIDFETRATEGAVANVSVSEPWNFVHGRYMHLAATPEQILLVTMYARVEYEDFQPISNELPAGSRWMETVSKRKGFLASVDLYFRSWQILGELSVINRRDPANPPNPEWGVRLWRSKIRSRRAARKDLCQK